MLRFASLIYIAKQAYRYRKHFEKGLRVTVKYADDNCDQFIYGVTKGVLIVMTIGFIISTIFRIFQ